MIQNDAVVLGLLAATLGVVFWTTRSTHPFWQGFYRYLPALVLCFSCGAVQHLRLIDGERSNLYFIASRRLLLPATLLLLTLAIDLPATPRLVLASYVLTASISVVLGGPAPTLWKTCHPNVVGWRYATSRGQLVGGAANQAK